MELLGEGLIRQAENNYKYNHMMGVVNGAPRAAAAVGNHKHQRRGGKVQLSAKDVELFGGFSIVNMHATICQE